MIIRKQKFFFFTSARIILDDKELIKAFHEKKYHYLTGLSYQKFDFGNNISIKHKQTILIDLYNNPEKMLRQFHDTSRNEVRKTFGMQEFSFISDDYNIDAARALYRRFEIFQKRTFPFPHSLEGHRLFSAYYNNTLISAILCYDAPPVLRARAIFSRRHEARSQEERNLTSYATRRLIFEACCWGHRHNYKRFDMGAINTTDSAKASIAAFKKSFGGYMTDEYTYEYRCPPLRFFKKSVRT